MVIEIKGDRTTMLNGAKVYLTPSQTDILELLQAMRGEVVTREHMMDKLYGTGPGAERKILDVHICRLRQKGFQIETVWGRGYRLPADEVAA